MNSRFPAAALIVVTLLHAPVPPLSAAEESTPIERGKAGLVEVPFVAQNQGPGGIACSVALAHWYSLELGQAEPGGRVQASLWFDPKDGTMALLNGTEDRMPVQALWCGIAGRSWGTRSLIGLERKAGQAPAPVRVSCRAEPDKLTCR